MFILLIQSTPIMYVSKATERDTYFAKVSNDSIFFYSLPINNSTYQLFEIPSSYFVLLLENENEDFYKAKYANIEGFVLKNSVIPINETPNYPYTTTSFRVFSPSSIPLQNSPTKTSESLTQIPSLEIITSFYGIKNGEELIPNSTSVWYYCSYLEDGISKQGYVFSYYCDQFQKIQPNNEPFTPITHDIFVEEENKIEISSELSQTAKALIAVGCCIPCLIIILLLLKKKSPRTTTTQKRIVRPRRDFYEFNEDDI